MVISRHDNLSISFDSRWQIGRLASRRQRHRKPDGHNAHARRRAGLEDATSRSSRAWSRARAGRWWTTPTRPLFDSTDFRFLDGEKSPWPWVMERPANEAPGTYTDWYFFGYGHDYKQALGDFVSVAGRIPLPPRFAFGAWWSRYWAYSDQELDELVRGFRENDTPLDVLVIDMDWHINERAAASDGRSRPVGSDAGLDRLHLEQAALSRSRCVSEEHARGGSEGHAESASGLGHPAVGSRRIRRWRAPWASTRRRRSTFPSTRRTRNGRRITSTWCFIRWKSRASISGGSTGSSSP